MNKTLILIIASAFLLSACAQLTAEQQWDEFKGRYGKNYITEEEEFRFLVFKQNLDRIKEYQQRDPEAQYGVTKFADLTKEEFRANYFGLNRKTDALALTEEERPFYQPTVTDIPASFDWRDHGAVTAVKNQGQCGSCWAFSTIQNIEGQYAIKHNELVVLSEQELVDCDNVDQGCNGGLMQDAMTWLQNNGGVALESDYPYTGEDGTCKFNKANAKVQVTGFLNVSTDEVQIAQSLVELGPLSIAVDAEPWQFYFGGITSPWFCNGGLDHGVLLVGYGTGKTVFGTKDYWIIKNSWGESWGEKGYIRLVRGKNACGMNQDVSTAVVA